MSTGLHVLAVMPDNNEDQRALETDLKSHVFKHLNTNRNCEELCDMECFEIIDSAISSYRLKLKEAMHITWERQSLNKLVKHVHTSLTIYYLFTV